MNIGLTPRSQHSMKRRQGKIVFILNPSGRDMSSTRGSGSSERGFLSFRSLSVEVTQRAVLRGGEDQG